jgi:aryl carrier-like protein
LGAGAGRDRSVSEQLLQLGGHSLLAVKLFTRIDKSIWAHLPLATLFEHPTVEDWRLLRQRGIAA